MAELASGPTGKREAFWPAAVVTLGISLTAAWVMLLGYGLVRLIELAI
jgi:hypothetical protein